MPPFNISCSSILAFLSGRHQSKLLFVTAGIVFMPFFTAGEILVAGTDSIFVHYPNILFGWDSIRDGGFSLWNPYIFAGTDFSARMHNHILNPVNWVLLAFPRAYVFHGLTALYYVLYVLIGYFSFRIARLFLENSPASLFFGVCVQLSGFAWFTTTTSVATLLTTATAIAIYLIQSLDVGKNRLNYFLGLTLSFFVILFVGHVGYIFVFGLIVVIVFALRVGWAFRDNTWKLVTTIVLSAAVFALAMAAVRLWPIIHALFFEHMGLDGHLRLPSAAGNAAYSLLTGFIPEALGYDLGESMAILGKMGVGGRHIQFHTLLYFGAVPTVLVFCALIGGLGRLPMIAALLFLAAALTHTLSFIPIADIFGLLFMPLYHEIVFRVLFVFFFLTSLLLGLRAILAETALPAATTGLRGFVVLMGCVMAVTVSLYAKVGNIVGGDISLSFLAAKFVVAASLIIAVYIAWKFPEDGSMFSTFNLFVLPAALITMAGLGVYGLDSGLFRGQRLVFFGYLTACGSMLWAVCTMWLVRAHLHPDGMSARTWILPALGLVALALLWAVPIAEMEGQRTILATVFGGAVGIVKFAVLSFCAIEIIAHFFNRRVSSKVFVLVAFVFTLGDLLFFNKLYTFTGGIGFADVARVFPDYSVDYGRMDLAADFEGSGDKRDLTGDGERTSSLGFSAWSYGGGAVKASVIPETDGGNLLEITNETDDFATAFRDIKSPAGITSLVFGAWVRTATPGSAGLMFGGQVLHSGSGKWEWMQIGLRAMSGTTIRPHMFVKGKGQAQFFAPRLVAGLAVKPSRSPAGSLVPTTDPFPESLDLDQYRVNRPYNLSREPSAGAFSSVFSMYRLRSYGGAQSDLRRDLYDLITAFEPPSGRWLAKHAILAKIDNPRLLDLLGVKYDVRGSGITVRPNAIARMSLFRDFEVVRDGAGALARLRQRSFDPTTTVIIDRDPGFGRPGADRRRRFSVAAFRSLSTERLAVDVVADGHSVLLFNDSYSPHWKVTVDGESVDMLRANHNFMAVPVPPGTSRVEFRFAPEPFLTLARISLILSAGIIVIGAYAGTMALRRRYRGPGMSDTGPR